MPVSREGIDVFALVSGFESRAYFKVLEVHLSAGANLLDHAVVQLDLGNPQVRQYVQNINLATLRINTPQAQIDLAGAEMNIIADFNGRQQVLHWGKVTGYETDIGNEEGINLVSRLEQTHFGVPLGFQKVFDPESNTLIYSDHDVVFNPQRRADRLRPLEHDEILGNKRVDTSVSLSPYPIFIDPASCETVAAAQFQKVPFVSPNSAGKNAEIADENWNLIEAVQYLCGECNGPNPNRTQYIQNPTVEELTAILPTNRAILKNHLIRRGLYLPEALDQLLTPYGYSFRIDYISTTNRKIVIFQGGVGKEQTVEWQAVGSNISVTSQQADLVKLEYDKSMAVNQVLATGDYTYLEATWDLKPGWPEEYDSTKMLYLIENGPAWQLHPEFHDVWRKWVLDEAGDYQREWAPTGGIKIPGGVANPILTNNFQEAWTISHPPLAAKRRRFHPMLTLGDNGEPLGSVGGCDVEFWSPFVLSLADVDGKPKFSNSGEGFSKLRHDDPTHGCRLLEHECGIRFTGNVPPIFIMKRGRNARVRITATIISDNRITGFAVKRGSSVNLDIHERNLDVASRFHARRLHSSSIYFSDVQAGGRQADQIDSRSALQVFAEQARDSWDQAQCSGTIRLEGLDRGDYRVGDLITRIKGREVGIAVNNAGAASSGRYPQIMGITYYVQQQKTLITINEFKESDAWIASFIRKTKHLK